MEEKIKHYEESVLVNTSAKELFAYADDQARLGSHMNKSSWMMGGGSMNTSVDAEKGQKIGSHIRMSGKILGIKLFLDEVVEQYQLPYLKSWKTVGELRLLIIGHYQMGFKITEENGKTKFTVFIDYKLPESANTRWLGYLFGKVYAKWCVRQMLHDAQKYFTK